MDSNSNYSQFIEHSFRRLSLLIHQQDVLHTPASSNKITEQSSVKTNINNNFSSPQPIVDDNSTDSIKTKVKNEPISRAYRNYMRPPKNPSALYRSSSTQFSGRSETSLNHSLNSSCSPSVTQHESNELPIHMPYERTLYDIRFERDHQNDIRQKYNIPPPFQRKWLRQPRYVPQEKPNGGQIEQSQNQ